MWACILMWDTYTICMERNCNCWSCQIVIINYRKLCGSLDCKKLLWWVKASETIRFIRSNSLENLSGMNLIFQKSWYDDTYHWNNVTSKYCLMAQVVFTFNNLNQGRISAQQRRIFRLEIDSAWWIRER